MEVINTCPINNVNYRPPWDSVLGWTNRLITVVTQIQRILIYQDSDRLNLFFKTVAFR